MSVIVRFRLECTVMMRMVRMMRMVVLGACVRGWLLGVLSCVVVMVMVMVVR